MNPLRSSCLYKDTYSQRLGVVVWRFFNDSPGASGGGVEGMSGWIITIPFNVEPSERDPLLKRKIVNEAAGIFAWVFAMTTEEMTAALANSGTVASSAAASIEHALERDPVVRFLLETYSEGIDRINGRDLFKQWCGWCAEVRHESGSETRFGGLIKKVRVGVEVDAQGVSYRVLKGHRTYSLTPMKDFPLGTYFGVVAVFPHPLDNPHHNLHPSNQPEGKDCEQRGDRGDSSSLNLERLENIYKRGREHYLFNRNSLHP